MGDEIWNEIEMYLEKMFADLRGVLKKEEVDYFANSLSFDKYNSSFQRFILTMIELVNTLLNRTMQQRDKNDNKNKGYKKPSPSNIMTKKKNLIQKKNSTFNDISHELVSSVFSAITLDDTFFWRYGVINRNFLFHVTNIMLSKKLLVKFDDNQENYNNNLYLLKLSPYISESVEKIGIKIVHNTFLGMRDMFEIVTRCYDLRMIDLFKSNASMSVIRAITMNCKRLTHLGLGKCEHINKEVIEMISENCEYLKVIQFPSCTTLKVKKVQVPKFSKDGKPLFSKLFGVQIEGYEITHNRNVCEICELKTYNIEYLMGISEIDGKILSSINRWIFMNQ